MAFRLWGRWGAGAGFLLAGWLLGAAAVGADTQPASQAVTQPATQPVEPLRLKIPEEQAALDSLMARFEGTPEIKVTANKRDKTSAMQVTGPVQGADPERKSSGSLAIVVDNETGRVTGITTNAFTLRNDEFKPLAALVELRSLVLYHNYALSKQTAADTLSGAGLAYLKDLPKLEFVLDAGTAPFNNDGLAAAAQIKTLKRLSTYHDSLTDEGVALLKGHPNLEDVTLGNMFNKGVSNKSLEYLAEVPKLAKLRISETWLTWEDGLKHLVGRKDTLKEIDLSNCLIDPADVAKLKEALPDVSVKWDEKGGGRALAGSGWLRSLAGKWIPQDVIDKAVKDSGAEVKP